MLDHKLNINKILIKLCHLSNSKVNIEINTNIALEII
jgi:hypothetical protein